MNMNIAKQTLTLNLDQKTLFLEGVLNLASLHSACFKLKLILSETSTISDISFSRLQAEDSSIFALLMEILRYQKNNNRAFHLLDLPQSLIVLIKLARLEDILPI